MEVENWRDRNTIVINVFFCGTAGSIEYETTQIGLFANECQAKDLMNGDYSPDSHNYKMYFDGCGVTNGTMGTLFATGLDAQCQVVVKMVRAIVKQLEEKWREKSKMQETAPEIRRIRLNCLGLSRGAIACLILARKVWSHESLRERVDVNLCLFDPVPGNSITSGSLDIFHATTAWQNIDLANVLNVRNVVALYPFEPLPDLAFHAPLIPKFAPSATVHMDVILGCHQGALYYPHGLETGISFFVLRETMESWGARFGDRIGELAKIWTAKKLLGELNSEFRTQDTSVRHAHCKDGKVIMRRKEGRFLNKLHQRLLADANGSSANENCEYMYMLDIDEY